MGQCEERPSIHLALGTHSLRCDLIGAPQLRNHRPHFECFPFAFVRKFASIFRFRQWTETGQRPLANETTTDPINTNTIQYTFEVPTYIIDA